jgi:hypothetical protein
MADQPFNQPRHAKGHALHWLPSDVRHTRHREGLEVASLRRFGSMGEHVQPLHALRAVCARDEEMRAADVTCRVEAKLVQELFEKAVAGVGQVKFESIGEVLADLR